MIHDDCLLKQPSLQRDKSLGIQMNISLRKISENQDLRGNAGQMT